MPNKTIYVREEDFKLWEQKYSPEWLHKKLNEGDASFPIGHSKINKTNYTAAAEAHNRIERDKTS